MVLTVAETRDGLLIPAALEAIAAAQSMTANVTAVVVGASAAVPDVARLAVVEVIALAHERLTTYTADAFTDALGALVGELEPACIVFAHTYQSRDYAPRLAARLETAFIPDCTGVGGEEPAWQFTRPVFGGKLRAEVVADGPGPAVVTFQAGAFSAEAARVGAQAAPVRQVTAALDAGAIRQKPEPPFRETRQTTNLAEAERIVAVGRGIKSKDHLPLVEALAARLGAELAASRPICDMGWLPMDRQVGSSGQTVRPKLYVAVGISGAIQHIVGMRGSRTIVAVNTDPDAPIFEIADFGIVGDLFEVVPALVAALET
jgi:electron transfer flavoprotein alpha subunit